MMKVQAIALSVAALGAAVVLNVGSAHADTLRAHAVPGEKIDSGLGDLPHYRHWADKTGRAPMGGQQLAQAELPRK
jgi:hypothetical protein